jgi:hypothetical protein
MLQPELEGPMVAGDRPRPAALFQKQVSQIEIVDRFASRCVCRIRIDPAGADPRYCGSIRATWQQRRAASASRPAPAELDCPIDG